MWIINSFEPLACRDCRKNLEADRATDFATAPDENSSSLHNILNLNLSIDCNITEIMYYAQSELLGQFRLISDRVSDVSGGRICLTQNAYAEI